MDLKKLKTLLDKHNINRVLLKDNRALSKMPKEVRDAFENIVENYDTDMIPTRERITPGNRRTLVVQDLLSVMQQMKD